MIPSVSEKVRLTENEGLVTISFDRDSWIDKIFLFIFNRPQTINVELDETGTKVINLIDGKRTIHEISEELKNSFDEVKYNDIGNEVTLIKYFNKSEK